MTDRPVAGRKAILAANRRGAAAFTAGDVFAASDAWEEAAKALGPADDDIAPAVWENAGLARFHLGCHDAAMRAFLRALDGDFATREQSLRFLVPCCVALGRLSDARRLLARYEARWGPHPDGWTAEELARRDDERRHRLARWLPG